MSLAQQQFADGAAHELERVAKGALIEVEVGVVVACRKVGPDHHVGCLAAMRLDALHEVGEVFTGAERALADDFLEDTEGIGLFLEEGCELWRVAAASCAADFLDIDFDVVHHSGSLEDTLGFRLHERIDRARRTARLEAHKGLVADDVAAAARVEPADIDARRSGARWRAG